MQGFRIHFFASLCSLILLLWLYSAQQGIFNSISHPLLLCRSCIIRNGNECICTFWKLEPTGWFHSAPIRIQSALRFYSVLQCFYILAHSMYKQTTGGKQRLEHGFTTSFTFFVFSISPTFWFWPLSVGLCHHAILCQQTGQKGLLWKVGSLHGFLPKQRGWNVSLASAPQWVFFILAYQRQVGGRGHQRGREPRSRELDLDPLNLAV